MDAPSQRQTLNPYFTSSHSEPYSRDPGTTSTSQLPSLPSEITGVTDNVSPDANGTTRFSELFTDKISSLYPYNASESVLVGGNQSTTGISSISPGNLWTDFNSDANVYDLEFGNSSLQGSTPIAFTVHIYGFMALFVSMDLFVILICFTSKRTILGRPANVAVLLLNVIFNTNFAILLLADPYGYDNIFPKIIITFVMYFKYLCFVISFWLIQVILKGLSSMKQVDREARRQRYRAFGFLCLGYACVMVTTGVITSKMPHLHILHLIPQAIYVAAIIVLCFTFLYSALNISQYTKQTCRVLDESIIYSKMQNRLKQNGRHADASLDLYRVKRGKLLGYEADFSPDDEGHYYPSLCNESDSSSNDSLTFCNEVAFTETDKIEEIFKQRKNGFRKQQNFPCKKEHLRSGGRVSAIRPSQQYAILESTTDCGFSTEDSDMLSNCDRVEKATPVCVPHKNTFPVKLKMQKLVGNRGSTTVFCNNAFSMDTNQDTSYVMPTNGSATSYSLEEHLSLQDTNSFNHNNRVHDFKSQKNRNPKKSTLPMIKLTSDKNEDNGYLADTEYAIVDERIDVDQAMTDREQTNRTSSPPPQSLALPHRFGHYLGLQRVRRGRCVHRIMQTTYCTSIFAFLLCVLELYEMFSVRGVLIGIDSSSQFTWLLFQSFMRFSELGFSFTVIRSIQVLCRKRRPSQRKSARKPVDTRDGHQLRETTTSSSQPLRSVETSPL